MNVNDQNNWGVVESASNFNLIIHHITKHMSKKELMDIKQFLQPELNDAAHQYAYSCLNGHELGRNTYANLKHAIDRLDVAIKCAEDPMDSVKNAIIDKFDKVSCH